MVIRIASAVGCVVVATPLGLVPQVGGPVPDRLLDYGAFGLVLAVVMVLGRILERVVERRNGNGRGKEFAQVLDRLDRTQAAFVNVTRTLDREEERLAQSIKALDRLDLLLTGQAAAISCLTERMSTAQHERKEIADELETLAKELRDKG